MAEEVLDQIMTDGPGQGQPVLADEHRAKLDSIVQQMVRNKESDSDIQMVVNDFKQKYSTRQSEIKQQKQNQSPFKSATDWLNIPQGYQPLDKNNVVELDAHTVKTGQAAERVREHLVDMDKSVGNLIYNRKKDIQGRVISEQLGLNPKEIGPINPQAQLLESGLRKDIPVEQKEIDDFKNAMSQDYILTRQALAQKAHDLINSDPIKAKQLKGDIYRLDRQNNPEKDSKIDENARKINDGEYDYDISHGVLTKPVGFFSGIVEGFKQKNQAFDEYGLYSSGKEEDIIKHLNKKIAGNPDEPTIIGTSGFANVIPGGEGGMMLGGQPLKPLAGGALAGWVGGPQAGGAAMSLISGPEMYKLGYASALPQNYAELKKKNPDMPDSEVYHKASELADKQASVDAFTGMAMGALGGEFAFKPTGLGANLLKKSVGSALKQVGEEGAKKALEGLGVGAIGGAGQVVKNLMSQQAGLNRETSEGVVDQLKSGAYMAVAMTLAAKAPDLLKPKTYNELFQSISRQPKEVIDAQLNSLEQTGHITQDESQNVKKAIDEHKTLDESIKSDVPESDRIKVQELIKKRNDLESSLEVEDKAYHADTKEKIKSLNEQINGISKGAERGELQKLVDQEHKDGNIEGFVTQTLKDASEGDLKKYFKEISEQAHDPNSEANTVTTFGENIVNKAKELFPKEEPKESKISVIQPGEIKYPDTTTIGTIDGAMVKDWKVGDTDVINIDVPNLGEIELTRKGNGNFKVSSVDLKKELRGKGLGKQLYYKAIEVLNKRGMGIEPGHSTSPAALGVWKVLEREGLAKIESIAENTHKDYPGDFIVKAKTTSRLPSELLTNKETTNAIPIRSSEKVHVGDTPSNSQEMGGGISESGGTSEPQEIRIPQEESGTPSQERVAHPTVLPGAANVYAEQPPTQLSFRGLQDTANEFGYEDVTSRDKKTDIQTRSNAEKTANEWASKGEYRSKVDEMWNKVDKKQMVPTDEQRLILEQDLANEKQILRETPKTSPEYDSQFAKVKRLKEIGNTARSEAGAALRLPEGGSRPHPITDEVDAMVAKAEANAVDKLTDQQKAEVESQVEKYKQASEESNKKISDLEEQVAKLDAQKEFNKAKSTTKRTKKTASERMAFRRTEVEAAREALRKLRSGESGLSAVPLPGVRELMAIAPHVKNIMVDLVSQGVDNLQDVISHLHTEFKDVLDGLTEKNIHDIIAGEYNEKDKSLSELQRQIKDLRDEAKYINQLESLLNGKEPKAGRAKIERNQKIKYLKEKIKSFKQEVKESEKFYGESNVGEKKIDKLRDELDRVKERRKKESPAKVSAIDKEISQREQDLRDKIKEAQDEWDKEKEAAKQRDRDYARMESERNRQLQRVSDLKEKLENIQKGIKAKGKGVIKKADTPEIEALKTQVADAEKELNKIIATEKRVKGLEDELDRLKQRKEKEPKEINKREISDKEAELKKQIDEERKAFNKEKSEAGKFYKEELDDDAKKLIAIKKRNQKLEQQIKERIANGQFEKEEKTSIFDREDVKKNYPRLRKDALDAITKKEEAQHEFDLALFNDEMKRRKWYQKAGSAFGKVIHTSKAIMSGIDDSATFVQNGLALMANPKIGAKAFINHAKDAFSNARFKRELAALHQRPDWEIIKKSGLEIVEPHSVASKQVEEAFEQNLLANLEIKGVKPWDYTGGIFERAFTSMGNNMRLLLFEKQMSALKDAGMTFESHPQEFKDAARVINELTGRGKLPAGLAQASPYITPFIWAPRMLASTLNTLGIGEVRSLFGKGYYQNLTPMQRKFALSQLGRGVGIGIAVMGAAALGGAKVDYDPRSVTFGDVIIGDHHYNVFGRYTPIVKVLVQAGMGTRIKGGGQEQDLDSGKFGAKTRTDVVYGFFTGKTTPALGTALNLAEHRNYFTNEPFSLKDVPGALLQPMSIKELRDGWKNDGSMTILNRFLPAFEGMKTSDERDFNKKGGAGGGAGATGSVGHKTTTHKNSHNIHKTR